MTHTETLKLALEALNSNETELRWKAITAIEQALAQPTSGDYALGYAEGFNDACKPKPKQEPVTWGVDWGKSGDYAVRYDEDFNDACKPKPAHEPVAWGVDWGKSVDGPCDVVTRIFLMEAIKCLQLSLPHTHITK